MRNRDQLKSEFFGPVASRAKPLPKIPPEKITKQALSIEWIIRTGSKIPGPGEYAPEIRDSTLPSGGKFNKFVAKGYLDDIMRNARETPGPTEYSLPTTTKVTGGKFNTSNSKSLLEWQLYNSKDIPGPGYCDIANSNPKIQGGRINSSYSKTDLDWKIYHASRLPGPGQYNTQNSSPVSGGKFNMSNPKSELDWITHRARTLPGPSDYKLPSTKVKSGGRFNLSRPKSDLDWTIYRAKELPGPGQYDAVEAMMAMEHQQGAKILGRSGPNLPWPYGSEPRHLEFRNHPEHKRAASCPPEKTAKISPEKLRRSNNKSVSSDASPYEHNAKGGSPKSRKPLNYSPKKGRTGAPSVWQKPPASVSKEDWENITMSVSENAAENLLKSVPEETKKAVEEREAAWKKKQRAREEEVERVVMRAYKLAREAKDSALSPKKSQQQHTVSGENSSVTLNPDGDDESDLDFLSTLQDQISVEQQKLVEENMHILRQVRKKIFDQNTFVTGGESPYLSPTPTRRGNAGSERHSPARTHASVSDTSPRKTEEPEYEEQGDQGEQQEQEQPKEQMAETRESVVTNADEKSIRIILTSTEPKEVLSGLDMLLAATLNGRGHIGEYKDLVPTLLTHMLSDPPTPVAVSHKAALLLCQLTAVSENLPILAKSSDLVSSIFSATTKFSEGEESRHAFLATVHAVANLSISDNFIREIAASSSFLVLLCNSLLLRETSLRLRVLAAHVVRNLSANSDAFQMASRSVASSGDLSLIETLARSLQLLVATPDDADSTVAHLLATLRTLTCTESTSIASTQLLASVDGFLPSLLEAISLQDRLDRIDALDDGIAVLRNISVDAQWLEEPDSTVIVKFLLTACSRETEVRVQALSALRNAAGENVQIVTAIVGEDNWVETLLECTSSEAAVIRLSALRLLVTLSSHENARPYLLSDDLLLRIQALMNSADSSEEADLVALLIQLLTGEEPSEELWAVLGPSTTSTPAVRLEPSFFESEEKDPAMKSLKEPITEKPPECGVQ